MDVISYIEAASQALSERKEEVNKLNVFPVPDGDTGTNMSLTLEMVCKELRALPPDHTLADIRKAITHGSLMGARGNSGVITSQILRGLCEGMEGIETLDAHAVATALARSVEVSFKAVRKPVEGTILTVIRDTAEAARDADEAGLSWQETMHRASEAAAESVKRTPELLPVLKENNVVDAGGFGLSIVIEAFVAAITGTAAVIPDVKTISASKPKVAIEQINDWAGSKYLYCTEFLLNAHGFDVEAAKEFLGGLGDCELIVGEEPDYKVHVHTDTPGTVLTYMTDRGQVAEVHIHNMKLQADDRTAGLAAEEKATAGPAKPLGFVAVAAGAGMVEILRELGVDAVVSGGQTMNPSTAELLKAVEGVNAESIIILPDNKNIIMAAQAAAEAASKPVSVVPTTSVPAAFSAMFVVDPSASLEENVAAMNDALDDVHYAEVTTAIKGARDAYGNKIHKGDIIGIADGAIVSIGKDVNAVSQALVKFFMDNGSYDTLTLLSGQDANEDVFNKLVSDITLTYPELDVDVHEGGQPLYPVVMSIE